MCAHVDEVHLTNKIKIRLTFLQTLTFVSVSDFNITAILSHTAVSSQAHKHLFQLCNLDNCIISYTIGSKVHIELFF